MLLYLDNDPVIVIDSGCLYLYSEMYFNCIESFFSRNRCGNLYCKKSSFFVFVDLYYTLYNLSCQDIYTYFTKYLCQ